MATATTIQSQTSSLTSNDAAVLSALFDPESSPSSSISITNTAPKLPQIPDSLLPELQKQEIDAIMTLNTESPPASAIEAAISQLSDLINQHPKYAPAYLNRAQATRLLISGNDNLFTPQTTTLTSQALSDLNSAISLTSPPHPTASLSNLQTSLLAKAHTHRGYILFQASQARSSQTDSTLPPELADFNSAQLEEMASQDFFLGGRYGNQMARELSVKTNPYAKMCGEIVREAMRREGGSGGVLSGEEGS